LNDVVMIAVDPHKASNTAAVLDPVTKTLIESARFASTMDGYAQLIAFAARWAQRRWAVEGCHAAGQRRKNSSARRTGQAYCIPWR
jgi:transposase